MNRRQMLLLAIGGAMVAALLVAPAVHVSRVANGREVKVATEAVDPRGLLVGHYAQLRLQPAFIEAPAATVASLADAKEAYVTLAPAPEPDLWRAVAISREKPKGALTEGAVVVRVRPNGPAAEPGAQGLGFVWGVDRIYLDQAEAEGLEKAMRAWPWETEANGKRPRVRAILSVDRGGSVMIKGVEIEGRRIETRW